MYLIALCAGDDHEFIRFMIFCRPCVFAAPVMAFTVICLIFLIDCFTLPWIMCLFAVAGSQLIHFTPQIKLNDM